MDNALPLGAPLVLLSSYCAILISYLTVSTLVMPFTDMEGLVDSTYELAQPIDANMQFLQSAPEGSCKCPSDPMTMKYEVAQRG